MSKNLPERAQLLDAIVEGLHERKGQDIISINLSGMDNVATDVFVIASATSDRHAQALADSVKDVVKEKLGERPFHTEGYAKGEWVLVDYVNIVVHIFLPRLRDFYRLEDLWADAPVTQHEDANAALRDRGPTTRAGFQAFN